MRYLLPVVVGLLFVSSASAQSRPRIEGGASFSIGNPVGEFGDNIEDPGFGGRIWGGVGPANSPVLVGADFGFLVYGRERRTEPFSTTIPDVTVEVVTTNNIVNGHLFFRLQPPGGSFRPYVDGLVGFKYLFTDTRIRNEGFDDEDIARSTNFDDAALSYGPGAGVQARIWGAGADRAEGPYGVYIDLGARYLFGTQAQYLKEGSIRREGTNVTFDVAESETNLLLFQIGVALSF